MGYRIASTRFSRSSLVRLCRVETAVRMQKDVATLAKASGDMKAVRAAQANVNKLMDYYDKISEESGIKQEYGRMAVTNANLPKANKEKSGGMLQSSCQFDIIKLVDEKIAYAVGAKNINDDVLDLTTGETFQIAHGSKNALSQRCEICGALWWEARRLAACKRDCYA